MISEQEADWHAHKAGVRASHEAAKADSSLALEALDSATPAVIKAIGGWELHPVTIGTSIEQGRLAEFLKGLPVPQDDAERMERDLLEIALMQMLYADTRRFRKMRSDGGWDALVDEANRLNYDEPYEGRLLLAEHLGKSIALIESLSLPSSSEDAEHSSPGKA